MIGLGGFGFEWRGVRAMIHLSIADFDILANCQWAQEICIVFDWDDTLLPSSFIEDAARILVSSCISCYQFVIASMQLLAFGWVVNWSCWNQIAVDDNLTLYLLCCLDGMCGAFSKTRWIASIHRCSQTFIKPYTICILDDAACQAARMCAPNCASPALRRRPGGLSRGRRGARGLPADFPCYTAIQDFEGCRLCRPCSFDMCSDTAPQVQTKLSQGALIFYDRATEQEALKERRTIHRCMSLWALGASD